MAKIFLDTNKFIDTIYRNKRVRDELSGHEVYISPLSVHILCYTQKIKVPSPDLNQLENDYVPINLSHKILYKSVSGPTPDLEDNIQLHSAAEADCDYFLTNDEKILKMKFFGKTKICTKIS